MQEKFVTNQCKTMLYWMQSCQRLGQATTQGRKTSPLKPTAIAIAGCGDGQPNRVHGLQFFTLSQPSLSAHTYIHYTTFPPKNIFALIVCDMFLSGTRQTIGQNARVALEYINTVFTRLFYQHFLLLIVYEQLLSL